MTDDRIRLLFVDDEPRVLDGLMRSLRPLRQGWDMRTAPSGEEALALMEREPVDVIISDMRMPGMNGAQLLHTVASRFPRVARFILSGQADRTSLLQAIETTHQFLAKPCDTALLRQAVDRALGLRRSLAAPDLGELVSRLGALPTLPDLYLRICSELRNENASLTTIADLVTQDIGLSAKVLQLANAAGFGAHHRIISPADAVLMLGIDLIRTLVLADHVFSDCVSLDWQAETLWEHSVTVAGFAKELAAEAGLGAQLAASSFTAGVLHDCGHVLLAGEQAIGREQVRDWHAAVGGYLLGLWGLPDELVEAAAYHHAPSLSPASAPVPLTMIHVAEGILAEDGRCWMDDGVALDLAYVERMGLTGHLPRWREMAAERPLPPRAAARSGKPPTPGGTDRQDRR